MKSLFGRAATTGWVAPIGASLQACHPRQRRCRRVVQLHLVLLSLMQDLQQHRGLTGAVLAGQEAFRDECAAVAEKLQRSLVALADHYGERQPVFRGDAWQVLLLRWQALRNNWQDLDFATSLSAHSELVLGVVAIVQALAAEHADCLGRPRTRIAAEWTPLVEHLGMLRALGIQRLGSPAASDDRCLQAAFKQHLHELRSLLASIAADSATDSPLLRRSDHLVSTIVAVRDGCSTQTPARYHQQMTRHIDDWYSAIRSGLRCD